MHLIAICGASAEIYDANDHGFISLQLNGAEIAKHIVHVREHNILYTFCHCSCVCVDASI